MRSGNLKHKIVFQNYTETQSETGAPKKAWIDTSIIAYANILPQSAKEFFKAGVHAEITHKIEMRYIPGITSAMRIKYGERIFEIQAPPINVRELNKDLHILCTEKL